MEGSSDAADAALHCARELFDLQGDAWLREPPEEDALRAALRPRWDGLDAVQGCAAALRAHGADARAALTRDCMPLLADYLEEELRDPSVPRLRSLAQIVAPGLSTQEESASRLAASIVRHVEDHGIAVRAGFLWPDGGRGDRANRLQRLRVSLLAELLH